MQESFPAFSHFGFFVRDLELMSRFYCETFGLVVTDHGNLGDRQLTFLSGDPHEHHQIVLVSGRSAGADGELINQISFRLSSLADLRSLHASVQSGPVSEIVPINHGTSWSVYFRDPEGNRVELYVHTPWYVPQPLREPLDLSENDLCIWQTTEARCRATPGFKTRAEWQAEFARRLGARRPRGTVHSPAGL